jgi:integrase/recombinase XerD
MSKALTRTDRGAAVTTAQAGDLLARFADFLRLNVAQGDASAETLRAYQAHARDYVAWCAAAGLNPATATYANLVDYRKHLVDHGYSRGTVAYKVAALRRLYEAARAWGLRGDNPAEGLKPPKEATAPEDRRKFLPLGGLARLLAAPQGDTPRARRDRAILALMGYHGLRVSEVAGLVITDYAAGDLPRLMVQGKGSKRREVYLVDKTTRLLDAWLQVRVARPRVKAIFTDLDNHYRGKGMTARAIRYLVDGYLAAVGLKAEGVSCHSLRHSFATWSLAGGAKLLSIAQALGHSSVETTQVYAKIVDKVQENPALYLGRLMTGSHTPPIRIQSV